MEKTIQVEQGKKNVAVNDIYPDHIICSTAAACQFEIYENCNEIGYMYISIAFFVIKRKCTNYIGI